MNMRTMLVKLVVGLFLTLGAGTAQAADSDDIGLQVTISNAVGVNIYQATYSFGAVALGGVTINTETNGILVDNNSGGIREDYRLSMVDNNADSWVSGTAAGFNTYWLQAMFKNSQPTHAQFHATNDNMTTSVSAASNNEYAVDSAADGAFEKGLDVLDAGNASYERTLWFRLSVPTSQSASPAATFTTVTVSAIAG